MIEYLGSIKMGGIYCNSISQIIPERPFDTDKNMFNGSGLGDIHSYKNDEINPSWTIGDTPIENQKIINWHKFKNNNRSIYVCDRVLINNISYQELLEMYTETYIYIDNKKYIHRIIKEEEWQQYVISNDKTYGSPSFEDSFISINKDVKNLNHNLFWNWIGVYTYVSGNDGAICYGYSKPKDSIKVLPTHKEGAIGLRPLLEEVYEYPIIDGKEGRLGEFDKPFMYTYSTVSYIDNDTVSVVEKIDDRVIREYDTSESINEEIIDLSKYWEEITVGVHKINIQATNKNGQISTKVAQFNTAPSTFVNKEGLDYFTQKFWNDKIKPFVTELSKRAGGLVLDSNEVFTGVGVKENTNLADNGVCIKSFVDTTTKTIACFSTNAIKLGVYGLIVRIATDTMVSGGSFSIIVSKNIAGTKTQIIKKDVNCSEFSQVNKYQNFYTTFEYNGEKTLGEIVEVEIQTLQNSNVHNLKLDYILISQMLPAVFL